MTCRGHRSLKQCTRVGERGALDLRFVIVAALAIGAAALVAGYALASRDGGPPGGVLARDDGAPAPTSAAPAPSPAVVQSESSRPAGTPPALDPPTPTLSPPPPDATPPDAGAPPQRPPPTAGLRTPWVGVNNWGLAASSDVHDDCGGDAERLLDQKMTHLQTAHVDVVRFAAYQSFATTDAHERSWTAFDRVFASANAHGIRLIPILGNNWTDCDYWGPSLGLAAKDAGTPVVCGGSGNWYDVGYRQPYNGYLTGYRQWVADLVGRYAKDPAIAAWELINEPWETCIHDFFVDMIGVVRAADATTPISLGSGGGGEAWSHGDGYRRETALADWATVHEYGHPDDPLPVTPDCPGKSCVRSDMADAGALGKPFYVGEAGIWESTDCDSAHRADQFREKMRAAFAAGASGYIVWAYSERAPAGKCGMDFGPDSPIMRIFAEFH